MIDIHRVMKELAKRRPVFHFECDFQLELAREIKKIAPDSNVRLEYPYRPSTGARLERLDVLVRSERAETAIELKYPTVNTDFEHQDERFTPGMKGLSDKGLYSCVEDISRLEQVIDHPDHPDIQFGIFVLLTNRTIIWQGSSQAANNEAFRLYAGRKLQGELVHKTNKDQYIHLRGSYELRWCNYRNLKTVDKSKLHKGQPQFRYLAVKVGKLDELEHRQRQEMHHDYETPRQTCLYADAPG